MFININSLWTCLFLPIPALAALTTATPDSSGVHDSINSTSLALGRRVFTSSFVLPDGTFQDATDALPRDLAAGKKVEARLTEATLVLTIGTKLQHVGYTVSRDLSGQLHDILNSLCDDQTGNIPGETCKREPRFMHNIHSTSNDEGTIVVDIVSDYIPNAPGSTDDTAILTLFQDQIVQAFKATISCDKNRYWRYRPIFEPSPPHGKQPTGTYICHEQANSADFYEIAIEGLPGDKKPHMRVQISSRSTGDPEGQFDCMGTLTNAWGTVSDHRVKYQYARALNVSMSAAIKCGDEGGKGLPTGECPGPFRPISNKDGVHCLGRGLRGPQKCEKFFD